MNSRLCDFFVGLAEDSKKLGEFYRDPPAVMSAFGLPTEDQQAILSGEAERFRQAVQREVAATGGASQEGPG